MPISVLDIKDIDPLICYLLYYLYLYLLYFENQCLMYCLIPIWTLMVRSPNLKAIILWRWSTTTNWLGHFFILYPFYFLKTTPSSHAQYHGIKKYFVTYFKIVIKNLIFKINIIFSRAGKTVLDSKKIP